MRLSRSAGQAQPNSWIHYNRKEIELVSQFALPFAVQVQCAVLGWQPHMHEPVNSYFNNSCHEGPQCIAPMPDSSEKSATAILAKW